MRLAVLADSHVTSRTETPQWAAFTWALGVIRTENADCALIAGDVTACGDMDAAINARNALDERNFHIVTVPGNSDVRTPYINDSVARLFMPPVGGRLIGGARVLGIDTSQNRISTAQRALMNISDCDSELILLSHHAPAQLDGDSREFMANWIRSRAFAGQKIRYWFSGHTHVHSESAFEGVRVVTVRALDPDKSMGGMPEIIMVDTETGIIEQRVFARGMLAEWSASEREEFREYLGITCYNLKDDMRFCIENDVRNIEWRGVVDADIETRELLQTWRRSGGRSFSQHLSSLAWDRGRGSVTGETRLNQTAAFAELSGADMVTVHPPYESVETMSADNIAYNALADRMADILSPLSRAGIKILIENNHTLAGDDYENRKFGCTPLEIIGWADALNCRLGASACALRLDVGHARNNAPVYGHCPLGQWYSLVGPRCGAYHLHQTHIDSSGQMHNHYPITGLDDGLVCFHGFMWAWQAGLLSHAPLILEIREGLGAPDTFLRLNALFCGKAKVRE